MASAENVDVQVRHGFAAARAVVDDEPVAAFFSNPLVRDFGGLEQQMAQQFFIVARKTSNPPGGKCKLIVFALRLWTPGDLKTKKPAPAPVEKESS